MTVRIEIEVTTGDPDGDLVKIHEVLNQYVFRNMFLDRGLHLEHVYVTAVETKEEDLPRNNGLSADNQELLLK